MLYQQFQYCFGEFHVEDFWIFLAGCFLTNSPSDQIVLKK